MVRSCKWFLMVAILLFCWVGSGRAAEEGSSPPPGSLQDAPAIQVAEPTFSFGEVEEGADVSHTFSVKNTGKGELKIDQVRPV